MNAPQLTPQEVREVIDRNLERGLAAQGPDGALFLAVADIIRAASARSDAGWELVPESSGGAVLAISQAADELSHRPGRIGDVAPLLLALVSLVKRLDEDRAALDERQARHLDLAQRWIAEYATEATPRRRRIRWPWSRA